MVNSTFQSESRILHSLWQGKITKKDIISFMDFLVEHDELPRHLYTMEQMEMVIPDFAVEELADLAAKMQTVLRKYKTIRSAVVSTQPLPVAYGMMYKGMTESFPNYKVEIFDSVPQALSWLGH